MPWADSLSWTRIVKKSSGLDNIMGLDGTNNEAESFAIRDALQCVSKFIQERPSLRRPVRVFGDSQLMICFFTKVFKWP